jgi:ketosteroid isomerase-like protein
MLIGFCACVTLAPAQMTSDPAALIRAARERSNRALASRDIHTFAESLAPDYVMVRGNGTFVPARESYLERMGEHFKNPKAVRYERVPDKIEISTVSPMAAEHGHWIATLPNGKRAYTGTYLAMWRRVDSAWKIRSELFVMLQCEDEATCAGYSK